MQMMVLSHSISYTLYVCHYNVESNITSWTQQAYIIRDLMYSKLVYLSIFFFLFLFLFLFIKFKNWPTIHLQSKTKMSVDIKIKYYENSFLIQINNLMITALHILWRPIDERANYYAMMQYIYPYIIHCTDV